MPLAQSPAISPIAIEAGSAKYYNQLSKLQYGVLGVGRALGAKDSIFGFDNRGKGRLQNEKRGIMDLIFSITALLLHW